MDSTNLALKFYNLWNEINIWNADCILVLDEYVVLKPVCCVCCILKRIFIQFELGNLFSLSIILITCLLTNKF